MAVVALGSNLDDPRRQVALAIRRLRTEFPVGFRASSLWTSSPVDCPEGSPAFVNAVCLFLPPAGASPESLLGRLAALEREFGRRPKTVLNEPRPLDLDLVTYGDQCRATPELTLPHPRAHLRRFVLEPLAEIAPDLRPPGWKSTVLETLSSLRTSERLDRLGSSDQVPEGTT